MRAGGKRRMVIMGSVKKFIFQQNIHYVFLSKHQCWTITPIIVNLVSILVDSDLGKRTGTDPTRGSAEQWRIEEEAQARVVVARE